jgi:hypothetical protein
MLGVPPIARDKPPIARDLPHKHLKNLHNFRLNPESIESEISRAHDPVDNC